MRNPFLVGEKVYLRAIEEADAAACYTWFSDAEVRRAIGRRSVPNTERDSREYILAIDGRLAQMFAIVTRADDVYIGNVELFSIKGVDRNAELGITIGRATAEPSSGQWSVVSGQLWGLCVVDIPERRT